MNDINLKRCGIIIPVYLEKLPHDDEMCVRKYYEVLKDEDIYFIAPESLDKSWYRNNFPNITFKLFEDKFFKGTKSYNHLMLNTNFYKEFEEYEYILIAQTDACIWINENKLNYFMDKGFDYIGAPWIPERRIWEWIFEKRNSKLHLRCCKRKGQGIVMGNGGFCLRNVKKTISLINEFKWRKLYWFFKRNEDIFFGLFGISNKSGFMLADIECGKEFSREYNLRESVKNHEIPFAVHGWRKEFSNFEEMSKYLKEYKIW